MKIIRRTLTLAEVVLKIKMVSGLGDNNYGNSFAVILNDGWLWPTTFKMSTNHITCKESELKKIMEFITEYEKVYQEEYGSRPEMTIVYDGGK
jgi:hypothetical protein